MTKYLEVQSQTFLGVLVSLVGALALVSAACGAPETDSLALAGTFGIARAKISEQGIRLLAVVKPMPQYPAASIQNKVSGIAVAEILVSKDGRPEQVNVLEAPDAHIRNAVEEALTQWEFRSAGPNGSVDGVPLSSKLTFYFTVENGDRVVRNPEELEDGLGDVSQVRKASGTPPTQITEAAVQELASSTDRENLVVLDMRERDAFAKGHRDGAVNIPANEILARTRRELPLSSHIVVECYAELGPVCPWAADELSGLGFSRVSLLARD